MLNIAYPVVKNDPRSNILRTINVSERSVTVRLSELLLTFSIEISSDEVICLFKPLEQQNNPWCPSEGLVWVWGQPEVHPSAAVFLEEMDYICMNKFP